MSNFEGRRVVFIHTVSPLIQVFTELCARYLPGASAVHVLDEPMLERVRRRGHLAHQDSQHLRFHVESAAEIGADAVLVTCSTMSPAVDEFRATSSIPVLKIDESMVRAAVRIGGSLAVVATSKTTLEPTRGLLEEQAETLGKRVSIRLRFVDRALEQLLSGNPGEHDRLVCEAVEVEAGSADVVLLAQASMARTQEPAARAAGKTPVLASPQLALEELGDRLAGERVRQT